MPTDFHVVEMCNGAYMPLILGRSFLATAGALVDLPNKRVCLSNINTSVFYEAIPQNADRHGSYVAIEESFYVVDAEHLDDIAAGHVKLKDAKEEVMHVDGVDRHPLPVSFDTHQETASKPNQQTMNKPESNRVNADSHITLTPQRRVGDHIEYKVKCKGMYKPFSKVKALITPERKAQGQAAVDVMMNRVLKLGLNPPPPLPDPSSDPHHL
ncbi:hypothetical protein V5N11_010481 [Cardamine amara subsp. amara]|uniref:Uncharacterized protein n=1 Tax=Cardamine amara subsp. amara TaxID=228776 RepID=A0ABD1BCS0_CARAN